MLWKVSVLLPNGQTGLAMLPANETPDHYMHTVGFGQGQTFQSASLWTAENGQSIHGTATNTQVDVLAPVWLQRTRPDLALKGAIDRATAAAPRSSWMWAGVAFLGLMLFRKKGRKK